MGLANGGRQHGVCQDQRFGLGPSRRPKTPTQTSAARSASRSRHNAKGKSFAAPTVPRCASAAPARNAAVSAFSAVLEPIQPGRGGMEIGSILRTARGFLIPQR